MLVINVSLYCQCRFIKCWVGFVRSVMSLQSFHWPDCRLNQLALDSTFMSERKCKQMKALFLYVWWMFIWLNYHWKLKSWTLCCVVYAFCSVQTWINIKMQILTWTSAYSMSVFFFPHSQSLICLCFHTFNYCLIVMCYWNLTSYVTLKLFLLNLEHSHCLHL